MDGEIDEATLREWLDDEDVRIVDIRAPAQFRRGHIPGSENVPFGELPDRVEELADADRIVTVCPHGKASVQAAELIGAYEGIDDVPVRSLACGIEGWEGDFERGESGATADGVSATEDEDGATDDAAREERSDAPF